MSGAQPVFRALSDPTRRDILMMLRGKDMTIAEVAQHYDMTRAAVKKHLNVLSDGGLIRVEARGRERINSLNPEAMAPIRDWLGIFDQFWDEKLSALKTAVEKDSAP
ncbi:helix-turn-helix transcriptional regulator [Hasllibacter sp. MH4015]|uniref:ArsR/SmtB family transcription factor n=1 Tax=Hasllibacter sp. MH4015 TaxID=2854029 RepID=UPI001CD4A879|nr:metalloregulator ArsR/SmtB family transcription factor [Hasllibacter sp. MH4015]